MRNTQRKPVSVGEMLRTEFMEPLEIRIVDLADTMGVHRNTLSNLIHDKSTLTAPLAMKLAAALGNTPEFWLNLQHACDLWLTRNQYHHEQKKIKPLALNVA